LLKADAAAIRTFADFSILRWYFLALNVEGAANKYFRAAP